MYLNVSIGKRIDIAHLLFMRDCMLWLRLLLADLSPRRHGFDTRAVSLGFVVDKVALREDFLRAPVFFFSCVVLKSAAI